MAQNYCRARYWDLATLQTTSDTQKLNEVAASKAPGQYIFVGLFNDITSWRWSLNNISLENAPYTNWAAGEPDNYAGREACGMMSIGADWWDFDCSSKIYFVCYNGKSKI